MTVHEKAIATYNALQKRKIRREKKLNNELLSFKINSLERTLRRRGYSYASLQYRK